MSTKEAQGMLMNYEHLDVSANDGKSRHMAIVKAGVLSRHAATSTDPLVQT